MNIAMLLDREFPHDDRVYKEAKTLISAGHTIYLICLRHDNKFTTENIDGIKIHRIYLSRFLFNKLSFLILIFPVYKWFWIYHLKRFLSAMSIDVLHIHDLPLGSVVIKLKKQFNYKLVIDMHEDYADWIVNTSHYNNPVGKLVKWFSNWPSYEQKCLQRADGIIGVSDKLIDKMKQNYQLSSEKLYNVPNAPDLSVFDKKSINHSIKQQLSGKYNIVYCGGIDFLRGIQNVIPTLRDLKKDIQNLQFVIVGDGSFLPELKRQAQELKVSEYILFAGYQKLKDLASFIYYSQIGIYPQLSYPGIDETLPTKLYQYCAMGIPVLSSDHKLPRTFINNHNCGYTVNFENKNDFISKVKLLHRDPDFAQNLGQNGKRAVQQNYNWETTSRSLVGLYKKIEEETKC